MKGRAMNLLGILTLSLKCLLSACYYEATDSVKHILPMLARFHDWEGVPD